MRAKRILLLPAVIILGLGLFFVRSLAQQTNPGLTVHPSNFELTINPGEVIEKDVTYENGTNREITINVQRRNFTAEGEEGGVNITAENTPFSLASWIEVSPTQATIPAHGSATFHFKVSPPKNAEAGGHFGSLVFGTNPGKPNSNGAAVSQEVTSLILVKIPGNVEERAFVQSLTTSSPFYEFGPVTFFLRIQNKGKIHVAPFGSIQVKDMFGNKYDAPLEIKNVLPNSTRKIPAVLSKKLLFGKYTGTLIASYGTKNQPLYASVEFWAFPVRYLAAAGILLFVLVLMRKRIMRAIKTLATGK